MNAKTMAKKCLPLLMLGLLSACNTDNYASATYPNVAPSAAPGGQDAGALASLLTGQIVNEEEQLLRDTLKRQILLDFPIKVGVVFYQFQSELDTPDREANLEAIRQKLIDSGLVSELIEIPSSLLSGSTNIEELRRLGARFQTDILVLVSGQHIFSRARSQNISFWDSFSNKLYYESKVHFEAITLDVYTGTLLSPFEASTNGEATLMDPSSPTFAEDNYRYEKKVENQTWQDLGDEALNNLKQLEADVAKRKAEIAAAASAEPSAEPTPAPNDNSNAADNNSANTQGA